MDFPGNNWSILNLDDCNNLSENYKMSLIQGLCKGKYYDICLAGGEIPEWFSHRGEGSALSFHLPSVSVPDGNKLQALLFWVVLASTTEATLRTSGLQFDMCFATLKNKSNGIELFDTTAAVTFDRNSTKHSWIQRVPLIGLEESLQGVEELELNVQVSFSDVRKCLVEKCGVHLIMEKIKVDSDIHGEKWDHEFDIHALGPSTTDDQLLESSLIRELQKWKITGCVKFG
ncbi:hypothetical protein DKX38_029228 [Salix brachista]|uniref:C-JID domain-containing protein n=1 Tax=Salix brachista TaxID=2182728 RepID=A0A5N5J258_9ROSI|nr:hypothetical protein DKX38_029228 [Salix brachista]